MKFSRHILASVILTVLTISLAFAGQTACPEHFAGGQAPDIINQKMTAKTKEICYSGFGLLHSGITRTSLYSAEHLTSGRLSEAKGMKRSSKFYADNHISASERAELHHYARSGYDRGHLAPSADMPDLQAQQECFSLANMIPQEPSVNRGVWEGIESVVRKMTKQRGELYIVTGPIFKGGQIERIGGAVMVPTQVFKAIYDPNLNEAGVYLVDNVAGAQAQYISVSQLQDLSGINIFPSVNDKVKSRLMNLPEPKERKRRGGY